MAARAGIERTSLLPRFGSFTAPGGPLLRTLAGHADVVMAVAVTPDGRQAVSASQDRTLKVWDLASGAELRTLAGHAEWVTAVAVTPDGRQAVSASQDRTLKVWDLASGAELRTLAGHAELGHGGGGDAGRAAGGLGLGGPDAEGLGPGERRTAGGASLRSVDELHCRRLGPSFRGR